MAAALYSKLDTIVTTLKNWQIKSPIGQVIDRVENYFNKVCLNVTDELLQETSDTLLTKVSYLDQTRTGCIGKD